MKTVLLACLLDPYYKNHAFSSHTILLKAKEWLKEDVEETQEQHAASEEEQGAVDMGEPEDERNPKRQQMEKTSSRIEDMFSSLLGPHTEEPLAKASIEDERNLYLKEPVIDRRNGDPFSASCLTSKKMSLCTTLFCAK